MQMIGYLLLSAFLSTHGIFAEDKNTYDIAYEWSTLKFNWPDESTKEESITAKTYIEENVIVTSIKMHKDKIYMALPRLKLGVPATLATIPAQTSDKSPLLTPFPDWEHNKDGDCGNLQSINGIEIDPISEEMWAIDTGGTSYLTNVVCKPALFLFNLKSNVPYTKYDIKDDVANQHSVLNDIVFDKYDGGFVYITDGRKQDPGIIVFSRKTSSFWRFKHKFSMKPAKNALHFNFHDTRFDATFGISGIALGPQYMYINEKPVRTVYYSPLSSHALYATTSRVLRNESYCMLSHKSDTELSTRIGIKGGQSSGMIVDEVGNLYYGLLGQNKVKRWRDTQIIVKPKVWDGVSDKDFLDGDVNLSWIDRFEIDLDGNIYMLSNNHHKFLTNTLRKDEINFRILKSYIGWKSYLHSEDLSYTYKIYRNSLTNFKRKIECPAKINPGESLCTCFDYFDDDTPGVLAYINTPCKQMFIDVETNKTKDNLCLNCDEIELPNTLYMPEFGPNFNRKNLILLIWDDDGVSNDVESNDLN